MTRFLSALLIGGFFLLSACSLMKGDSVSDSSSDRVYGWGDADITNLSDTKLTEKFKNSINPIVYFEFDSVFLNSTALDILNEQIAWLKKNPDALIVIEGHCDERGTREYNLALGERRAATVQDYFVLNGIAPNRIRIISYGKERPDVFGSTETSWSKNRRAVTIVN